MLYFVPPLSERLIVFITSLKIVTLSLYLNEHRFIGSKSNILLNHIIKGLFTLLGFCFSPAKPIRSKFAMNDYNSSTLDLSGRISIKRSLYFVSLQSFPRVEMKGIRQKVEAAIEEIRPNLQADGGDIELVDVENGVAKVRLKGACAGCPMSTMTIKLGVENFLKKKIPEITKVETV